MTSNCQFYSLKDKFKGWVECNCGSILNQDKYNKHLLTQSHINYNNYLVYRKYDILYT